VGFLTFVCYTIPAGELRRGDFFIFDNASIHFGGESHLLLINLFHQHGINYLFLPTYSPELNPCELVFAYIKHFICNHRTPGNQVHTLMLTALSRMPFSRLVAFYWQSIQIQELAISIYLFVIYLFIA